MRNKRSYTAYVGFKLNSNNSTKPVHSHVHFDPCSSGNFHGIISSASGPNIFRWITKKFRRKKEWNVEWLGTTNASSQLKSGSVNTNISNIFISFGILLFIFHSLYIWLESFTFLGCLIISSYFFEFTVYLERLMKLMEFLLFKFNGIFCSFLFTFVNIR